MDLLLQSSIRRVLLLRSVAIALQLLAVLVAYYVLDFALALLPLLSIIAVESLFQLLSVVVLRRRIHSRAPVGAATVVWQLLADILFLTLLLMHSGGATNAFVSLLLLPVMIAAVTLPGRLTVLLTVIAIAAYSALVMMMPLHHQGEQGMQMRHHFIAMWINFVLSAVVVATLVSALSRTLAKQQRAIAQNREEQLRAEQLVSLGSAAAQATHQLATPLANLALLHDEARELSADSPTLQPVVDDMAVPLTQCQRQLDLFRARAQQLRDAHERAPHYQPLLQLVDEIRQAFTLNYPSQQLHCQLPHQGEHIEIISDPLLSAAVINVLANAVRANEEVGAERITITIYDSDSALHWRIEDQGRGFSAEMQASLGSAVIASSDGFGVALWLTNATIERIGGTLALANNEHGACIDITIPKRRYEAVTD